MSELRPRGRLPDWPAARPRPRPCTPRSDGTDHHNGSRLARRPGRDRASDWSPASRRSRPATRRETSDDVRRTTAPRPSRSARRTARAGTASPPRRRASTARARRRAAAATAARRPGRAPATSRRPLTRCRARAPRRPAPRRPRPAARPAASPRQPSPREEGRRPRRGPVVLRRDREDHW